MMMYVVGSVCGKEEGPEGPMGPEGRRGRKWVHISTQHGHFDGHEKERHEWEDSGERRLKGVPRGRLLFLIHVCKIVLTLPGEITLLARNTMLQHVTTHPLWQGVLQFCDRRLPAES